MSNNPYQPPGERLLPLPTVRLSWRSMVQSRVAIGVILFNFYVIGCPIIFFWTESFLPPAAFFGGTIGVTAIVLSLVLLSFVVGWLFWRRYVLMPLRQVTAWINDRPAEAELYVQRGTLYLERTKELARAIDDFTAAIALERENWTIYAKRGEAYLKSHQHESAIADLTMAIVLAAEAEEPIADEWKFYGWRAEALRATGEPARAIADVTEAIGLLESRDSPPRNELARLYYQRAMLHGSIGDRTGARTDFKRAHRLDSLFWDLEPRIWVQIWWGLFVVTAFIGALVALFLVARWLW